MAEKYHFNPDTGTPGLCTAQDGRCPYGGVNDHYSSIDAARQAYERKMDFEYDRAYLEAAKRNPRKQPFTAKKGLFIASGAGMGTIVAGPVGTVIGGIIAAKAYQPLWAALDKSKSAVHSGLQTWKYTPKTTKVLLAAAGVTTLTTGPLVGAGILGTALLSDRYKEQVTSGFHYFYHHWQNTSSTKKAILVGSGALALTTSAPLIFAGLGAWTAKSIWWPS